MPFIIICTLVGVTAYLTSALPRRPVKRAPFEGTPMSKGPIRGLFASCLVIGMIGMLVAALVPPQLGPLFLVMTALLLAMFVGDVLGRLHRIKKHPSQP